MGVACPTPSKTLDGPPRRARLAPELHRKHIEAGGQRKVGVSVMAVGMGIPRWPPGSGRTEAVPSPWWVIPIETPKVTGGQGDGVTGRRLALLFALLPLCLLISEMGGVWGCPPQRG